MKQHFKPFFLPVFLVFLFSAPLAPGRTTAAKVSIKVACIGNSITYGSGIKNREAYSYPAQLGQKLGRAWDVRNFGVSGATLLKNGDKPYWDQEAYQRSLDFAPDIVVIKLGTNDSKPQNWKYKNEFYRDYRDLISRFEALPSKPKIFICTPVPAYDLRWGIRDEVIREEQMPIIKRLANDTGCVLIDLYGPLSDKEEMFPDKIHPDMHGAAAMARVIYRYVSHC
jgi:lysophospholipase L1-like esterase